MENMTQTCVSWAAVKGSIFQCEVFEIILKSDTNAHFGDAYPEMCEYSSSPLIYSLLFLVLDDEDSNNITAGSIVTVTVTLTRKRMAVRHVFI